MPNRLAQSSSPYLLQHKDNPVDWFPWGDEAFEKAKAEDKPVFLSVGYSACHWCHVMEHESFENEQIAAILNKHFVAIKVDREERPDIDQVYMQAVQMLTGSGGWPMSVFMAPDGKPFYGGTYWPPDNRFGRPGFGQVLLAIHDAWENKRDDIVDQAAKIQGHLKEACEGPASVGGLDPAWVQQSERWLVDNYDHQYGGYGNAPKFPHATDVLLLIEGGAAETPISAERETAIRTTLDNMAQGGIYDHLGGGFARYSVDRQWLVPHFEKMLYDNSLLAMCYADAYRLFGDEVYLSVVRETLDYILRDMTNDQGGFHSTEDADSEGVEGKFYVWSVAELKEVLGDEKGDRFCAIYDVTEQGNFEGHNILNLKKPLVEFASELGVELVTLQKELREDRDKLLDRRSQRIRPGLDDKVLLSWNALMISGMVRGYRATFDPKYLAAAERAIAFVESEMMQASGRPWHTWRAGKASLDAFLDDYAYLIVALTDLFQVAPKPNYLKLARSLGDVVLEHFVDPKGGFFFTADDSEELIARSKDLADSSVPSGNAMTASGMLSLGRLTGDQRYVAAAQSALLAASGVMTQSPQAAGESLRALRRFSEKSEERIIVSPTEDVDSEVAMGLYGPLRPHGIELLVASDAIATELLAICPLLNGRTDVPETTLYNCRDSVCELPVTGPDILASLRGG